MVMANNLESYVINTTFLSELMTGILSSPIIIIPHFHYPYVDEALNLLIEQCCHNGGEGSVKLNHILEIDESRGIIDFETKKRRESTTFQAILEDLLDQTNEYERKPKRRKRPKRLSDKCARFSNGDHHPRNKRKLCSIISSCRIVSLL